MLYLPPFYGDFHNSVTWHFFSIDMIPYLRWPREPGSILWRRRGSSWTRSRLGPRDNYKTSLMSQFRKKGNFLGGFIWTKSWRKNDYNKWWYEGKFIMYGIRQGWGASKNMRLLYRLLEDKKNIRKLYICYSSSGKKFYCKKKKKFYLFYISCSF